ncbi:MAG: thiamine-phosphate kinase [Pyrinomonadaceae bacterium]|nr:thiamine-phosphate kinase [Pyrinomonadaceae bacterium]
MPRSEFQFLRDLKDHFNLSRIGDDCAVFPKDESHDYLITSDMLVEGIDFKLEWTRPNFIGHKALAVSISDVAAMGGNAVYSLVSLAVPEKLWNDPFLDTFYEGYSGLARKFETELVGGDISRTDGPFTIDSTIIGIVNKGKAVLRSGANPGDSIYVTGPLGGAAGGLKLLESGTVFSGDLESWKSGLLIRQLTPFPANLNSFDSLPTAMIDISDGFSSDLDHICKASGVGARIYADKIPVERRLRGLQLSTEEKLNLALHGGEDFELLFTADTAKVSEYDGFLFEPIGEITDRTGKIEIVTDEDIEPLDIGGFSHF